MRGWLKLTDNSTKTPVYIQISRIQSIKVSTGQTRIYFGADENLAVTEKIDEVMDAVTLSMKPTSQAA